MTPLRLEVPLRSTPADRRLLPEGRIAGPMPWVIAIMMFLTALATAAGMGLGAAARALGSDLASRISIQIVEANPAAREEQAQAVLQLLSTQAGASNVERLGDEEMARLLEPWLGAGTIGRDLPVPVLIDAELSPVLQARLPTFVARIRQVAPSARVDDNAQTIASVSGLIDSLRWLAFGLVALMAAATMFVVILAARAALNTHRATIDVMHLLGATDIQIARLFQRRIALDALFGSLLGLGLAIVVLLLMGQQLARIGSELLGSIRLPLPAWTALLALPPLGALLALFAARFTVLAALRRIL